MIKSHTPHQSLNYFSRFTRNKDHQRKNRQDRKSRAILKELIKRIPTLNQDASFEQAISFRENMFQNECLKEVNNSQEGKAEKKYFSEGSEQNEGILQCEEIPEERVGETERWNKEEKNESSPEGTLCLQEEYVGEDIIEQQQCGMQNGVGTFGWSCVENKQTPLIACNAQVYTGKIKSRNLGLLEAFFLNN